MFSLLLSILAYSVSKYTCYWMRYPDLKGFTIPNLQYHYENHGINEDRIISCDGYKPEVIKKVKNLLNMNKPNRASNYLRFVNSEIIKDTCYYSVCDFTTSVSVCDSSRLIKTASNKCYECSFIDKYEENTIKKIKIIDLVISYCNEQPEWIIDVVNLLSKIGKVRIFIISKCQQKFENLPLNATIKQIENVGRCDHSWAYYLYTYYDNLGDIVFFLKDTTYSYPIEKLSALTKTAKLIIEEVIRYGFTCGRNEHQSSMWHERRFLWKFSSLTKYTTAGGIADFINTNKFYFQWLETILGKETKERLTTQNILPVCYGGSFAFSSVLAKRQSRQEYKNIMDSLSVGDNVEVGHYAERTWASLLAPHMNKELQHSFKSKYENNVADIGSILGMSYTGSITRCCCKNTNLERQQKNNKHKIIQPVNYTNSSAVVSIKRVILFSHSLDMDGAPKYLFMLAKTIKKYVTQNIILLSPTDGALRNFFEDIHVNVLIRPDIIRDTNFIYSNLNVGFNDLIIWNTILWTFHIEKLKKFRLFSPNTMWILHEYEIDRKTSIRNFWYGKVFNSWKIYWNLLSMLHSTDAVVFVANRQKDLISEKFDTKNLYVLPGAPDKNFDVEENINGNDLRKKLNIDPDAFVITMVGTYCSRKRQLWAISAMEYLKKRDNDNVYLLLIGKGSKYGGNGETSYIDIIEKNSLNNSHIILLPFEPSIKKYYSISNLHLSASSHEAYPLNILEALNNGVNVVSTDAGGSREILYEEFIVPTNSPDKFNRKVYSTYKKIKSGQVFKSGTVRTVEQFQNEFKEILNNMLNVRISAYNMNMFN